ncbi:hypothetical protein ACAG24_024660 [Mycobacterium sp. pW049]|uniref:DUF7373 family lipoprotein n=1 Tax=[Mycobacterium] bulgaricum TaxID=3238985 RepID=UPI00351B1BE0
MNRSGCGDPSGVGRPAPRQPRRTAAAKMLRSAGAILAGALLAGCSATTTGTPTTAPQGPDSGAIVALMDSGNYPTAAGKPFGVAGDDIGAGNVLEAHRLAEYTVGPWEIDADVKYLPGWLELSLVGPIESPTVLRSNNVLAGDLPDIAQTHGFVAGFSTTRTSIPVNSQDPGQQRWLNMAVLRFPNPAAAAAAATEMAAKQPPPPGAPGGQSIPLPITPEGKAIKFPLPDNAEQVISFTAHGPYVVYVVAQTAFELLGKDAATLAGKATDLQKRRLAEFTPTDLAALRDLPLDPTGQLLTRTLIAPDGSAPFMIGVWNARAWLHFETDPVLANALFSTASVDVVSQRTTTVYRAANPDGAARVADGLADHIGNFTDVHSIDGVAGLPAAKCYKRHLGALPSTSAMTWQRVFWAFECVATVDRYAYTAFSATEQDVRQQMAAQYRILAGQ